MTGKSRPYALDSNQEPMRLENQARLAEIDRHLAYIPLRSEAKVLDAGCGSGSMARVLARQVVRGHVIGVDIRQEYLDFAKRLSENENVANITFQHGDIFDLPFEDGTFDVVWSKYVLQWVNDPAKAVAEFKRVTRPGGIVVCCNADNLLVSNYPVDQTLQSEIDIALRSLFDPDIGRKMYAMFHEVGFKRIKVDIEADRLFSIFGTIDEQRRSNIAAAYETFVPYMLTHFKSHEKVNEFIQRHLDYLDREDTISPCLLYFVQGTVL